MRGYISSFHSSFHPFFFFLSLLSLPISLLSFSSCLFHFSFYPFFLSFIFYLVTFFPWSRLFGLLIRHLHSFTSHCSFPCFFSVIISSCLPSFFPSFLSSFLPYLYLLTYFLSSFLSFIVLPSFFLLFSFFPAFVCLRFLIAHLHDDVIWLQLPECISLRSLFCRCVTHERFFTKETNTENNSFPQSILVVVVNWRHHANVYSHKCLFCFFLSPHLIFSMFRKWHTKLVQWCPPVWRLSRQVSIQHQVWLADNRPATKPDQADFPTLWPRVLPWLQLWLCGSSWWTQRWQSKAGTILYFWQTSKCSFYRPLHVCEVQVRSFK